MRLIYSILYSLVLLVLFFPEYLKRPRALRSRWLREKTGAIAAEGPCVWIHAVSVGEVHAALPLITAIRQRLPAVRILVTTITDTGQAVARQKLAEDISVAYLPFDLGFLFRRAFRALRPMIFIIMETELWPNLLWTAQKELLPVALLNGRISAKSAGGYRRVSFFMRRVLHTFSAFGMQTETDAGRIIAIGAEPGKVTVTGNFKFDISLPEADLPWASGMRGPVIVAGSTHAGEEGLILSAFTALRDDFPALKLIIAPRHPERFEETDALLRSSGLPYRRRSALTQGEAMPDHAVILLDTVGELASVYRLADIAVIGKSFLGAGGQNPLEAAYWGKAIVCGPHMENFPFMRDFLEAGAAVQTDAPRLAETLAALLRSPEKAKETGIRAREFVRKNTGAVERSISIIGKHLTP